MAEVGILNLQIKDNSKQAIDNLGGLVDALSRLKTAVGEGIKLSGVATSIKRIAETVNTQITGSTLDKIERLTSALSNLQGIGNVRITIKDSGDTERIRQAVADTLQEIGGIGAQFENAKSYIDRASDSAREFASFMRGAAEIVEQTNWTGGFYQFNTMLESMLRMKSMFALGPGQETGLSTEVEKGWSYWKDGAIEVEGTVSEAFENIGGYLEGTQLRLTGIVEETREAASATREYSAAMEEAAGKRGAVFDPSTGEYIGTRAAKDRTDADMRMMENEAKRYRFVQESFADSSEKIKELVAKDNGYKMEGLWPGASGNTKMTDNLLNMDKIDLMTMKLQGMTEALNDDIRAGKLNTQQMAERAMRIQDYRDKLEALKNAQSGVTEVTEENTSVFSQLKGAMQRMFPTISGMLKRFAQIAKYRLLRTIIMQITKGFREGVENLYHYSKAVGTSFAPAMDSAATALLQMKNSLGAAAAPVIQALIPYLQQVVSWFINLINYVNQFFALIRGQSTWTRALPASAEAFKSTEKAAKGAGSAMKDLLADWDELNIIQSESGGGGAGGAASAAEDYLSMFEEVGSFDNRIKMLVDEINDMFGNVWNLVKRIGIALLGWKFAKAFSGILGTLGGLVGTAVTIGLIFDITTMFNNMFLQTGDEGWLIGNVLTALIGGVLMSRILGVALKGQTAKLGIPIALTVSSIADIVTLIGNNDVSAISKEGLELSALSALKLGAAAAFLSRTIMGNKLGPSLAGGAAIAIAVMGGLIGLKATVQAMKSGVTEDTIKSAALSSLMVGIGSGLFAKLAGASLLGAGLFGLAAAGVTILTIAAAIGIKAIITSSKEHIQWGSESLTENQIKEFVRQKMFNVDVETVANLVNTQVTATEDEKNKIREQAAGVLTEMNVVRLGLATEETYSSLKKQLFGEEEDGEGGLIKQLKDFAEQQKTVIKTSFTLAPMVDAAGAEDSNKTAEALAAGLTGWSEVERYMTKIGGKLSEALTKGATDELDGFDDELILKLTTELQSVQDALTEANASSSMIGNIQRSLTGMDEKSVEGIVNVYKSEQERLRNTVNDSLTAELTSYKSLAAFYRTRGQDGDEDRAKEFDALADQLVGEWDERLKNAVKRAAAPGGELIAEALMELVSLGPDEVKGRLHAGGETSRLFSELITGIFQNQDISPDSQNKRDLQDSLYMYLYELISGAYEGTDLEMLQYALDNELIGFGNLFTEDAVKTISKEFKDNSEYGGLLETLLNELIEGTKIRPKLDVEPEIDKNDIVKNLKEAVEDAMGDGLTIQEKMDIGTKFNITQVELDDYMKQWGYDPTKLSGSNVYGRAMASAGVSDVGYANANYTPETVRTTPDDENKEISNMETGVRRGTSSLLDAINNLISVAQSINRKDFTVKITPSSGFGRSNAQSAEAWDTVTGR